MKNENKNYLFVHFTGESPEGEQVYFSLSKDGMHWEDMNKGKPVLRSETGEKGVRDPFILRSVTDGRFYIIATDLRIANGKGWDAAQYKGSTQMIIWTSEDLIHWSKPWTFETGVKDAGCVWAPEAVYDPEKDAYLVFWASMVKEPGEKQAKQRIYASYTKDFKTFTKAEKYIEREHHVIDTTIIREDGVFYRFSKDETTKNIRVDYGEHLMGEFEELRPEVLDSLIGVEGPAAFPMNGSGRWCLLVDQFAKNLGYLPLICSDLKKGDFRIPEESEYDMGIECKRHGSVLVIDGTEYERIRKKWGNIEAE